MAKLCPNKKNFENFVKNFGSSIAIAENSDFNLDILKELFSGHFAVIDSDIKERVEIFSKDLLEL